MQTLWGISDFLFARPSYLQGVGSVMDLGGTMVRYNESASGAQADAAALQMDWRVVGEELQRAMNAFAAQHPELQSDGSPPAA